MRSRRFLLALGLTVGIGLAGLAVLQSSTVQNWLNRESLLWLIARSGVALPFEVLEARLVEGSLQALFRGKEVTLRLRVRKEDWEAELVGPLRLHRGPPIYDLEYAPKIDLIRARALQASLRVQVRAQTDLKRVEQLEARIEDPQWRLPGLGVEIRRPKLSARYQEGMLRAEWEFEGLSFQRDENRQVELGPWKGDAGGALEGPWTLRTRLGSAEALWESRYVTWEKDERVPIEAVASKAGARLRAQIGTPGLGRAWVEREGDWVRAQLDRVPLAPLLGLAEQVFGAEALGGARAHSASITATLEQRGKKRSAQGSLLLDHVSSLQGQWAVQEGRVEFDVEEDLSAQIRVEAGRVRMRRLDAAIPSFTLEWTPIGAGSFRVRAPELRIALPMTSVRLGLGEGSVSSSGKWEWETELDIDPAPARAWAEALCLPLARVPPGSLSAQFPSLELGSDEIHAEGEVSLDLFEGRVELRDPAIFDYATEVPETQFDLMWKGIRLDRLGDWLGFGEMDGFLEGYSRETTVQALLPTQFDFRVEVTPHRYGQVVFSPEAMKNTVRLFAGDDLDTSLPGIVDWFAFGWPSKVFGGYNVNYAGISLYGVDGAILVSPLREGQPFLLYGPRFRIPLRGNRYPIVIDAYAMSNFMRRLHAQIENLRNSRENATTQPRKDPTDEPKSCFVDFPPHAPASPSRSARGVRDGERELPRKRGPEGDR